jgi:hypothetical protein
MIEFCDVALSRWIFKAIVYKKGKSRGFVGYGDADPSNVTTLVHGAEMRIAETRAVNRALRKAYGIDLCSVEELGSISSNRSPTSDHPPSTHHSSNGSNNGQPRLRDQLCLLIRQHNLDPTLVKAYAADFCGTPSLKEANRDLVQSFISHLTACTTWLHKAKELPKEGFKGEVERHLTGKETEPWEIVYFKLYKSQLPVVEKALETAGLMLGTDKSRGYCLEMICADFLAGARQEEPCSQTSGIWHIRCAYARSNQDSN